MVNSYIGKNNMYKITSQIQKTYFINTTSRYVAEFSTGKREQVFEYNGISTDKVDYAVLKIKFFEDTNFANSINVKIKYNDKEITAVLEKNPYDGTYVCDVKKIIDTTDVVSAKIIAGEFVDSVQISNVASGWNVNHENALKLACSELKKELNTLIENDEFCGECYIKILNDTELKENHYFWYVNFVSRHGKTFAVIIDPISNEIMAKKTI